jgi:small subunit ribosomal protein S21
MAIRIKARHNESVGQMLRRFKKLCEKEGLTKDIKRKQYFEKPSERRRRDQRRSFTRTVRPTGGSSSSNAGGEGGGSRPPRQF